MKRGKDLKQSHNFGHVTRAESTDGEDEVAIIGEPCGNRSKLIKQLGHRAIGVNLCKLFRHTRMRDESIGST